MTTEKPVLWSPQQQAVFDWVERGRGSAFVEAVAGAGKTTTILEACKRMDGYVSFAAYNRKIAKEIEGKAAKSNLGPRVSVGTFHSFGLRAWRKVASGVKVADGREKNDIIITELGIRDECIDFVFKLASMAKQSGLGLFGSVDDDSRWWDLVEHYDIMDELENIEDAKAGLRWAKQALALSKNIAREIIDFDDMIYMPIITGCRVWQNDWLLVDEAQDTNAARRALARKMLKPGGRAIFVGDRHQAIYGFAGADAAAVDNIVSDFACRPLPLTITYRCPKAVVAMARRFVGHIEAHPTAPVGTVVYKEKDDIFAMDLGPRDAILCRLNRPIISLAHQLLRKGIACHVEGRDIGAGLIKLVNRWKSAKTVEALTERLEKHRARETEKFIAKGQETKAEQVQDRVDTMLTLLEGCGTIAELRDKIRALFSDTDNGHEDTLTLSTVHKSKGREWGRVFVLEYDKMPSPWARQDWQKQQETNLIYVAYTRAQAELILVAGAADKKKEPETVAAAPAPALAPEKEAA